MKIAILGANGKAGSTILKEAIKRGLDVTAIVRHPETIDKKIPMIEKSVADLTTEDIKKFDVLVCALGFWQDTNAFITSMEQLIVLLTNQKTRLLVVGGAGSLYTDETKQVQLSDTPDFPDAFKPVANAMKKSLEILRHSHGVNWTYLSPAAEFDAEGKRTGTYLVAGEVFETNANGKSYISYEDYAIAMVDEIENNTHPNQRFSVHQ